MKLYPDYIKLWSLVAVTAAVGALTGCSDEIDHNIPDYEIYPSDCLSFTTTLVPQKSSSSSRSAVSNLEITEEQWIWQTEGEDTTASRGTIANHLSGYAGVLGFKYDNEDGSDKTPIVNDGYNNLKCQFNGDNLVSTDATILWSSIETKHLNIYSYAPYIQPNTTTDPTKPDSMKLDFTTAPPTIDYIVPDLIAHQKDILVASWISKEHKDQEDPTKSNYYKNHTIPLSFNHILTAIRFRVGFECNVKSVAIENVYNNGRLNLLTGTWENVGLLESSDPSNPSTHSYKVKFKGPDGEDYIYFDKNNFLTGEDNDDNYMIMMPQTLPANAKIVLTCVEEVVEGEKTVEQEVFYTADLGPKNGEPAKTWEPGKLMTYTFHKGTVPGTIYFDLAAGDVTISANANGVGTYLGYVFKDGKNAEEVKGEYKKYNDNNELNQYNFYVYQSSTDNRADIWDGDVCTPPKYDRVKGPNGGLWSEFITDNTKVDESTVNTVIKAWDVNNNALVEAVGRSNTEHRISIIGNVTCDLTIDNIYSTYQQASESRTKAGISFIPLMDPNGSYNTDIHDAKVTIKIVGDNRVGAVHYFNHENNYGQGNELIFEGTGSLTVADVDGKTKPNDNGESNGYHSNHWDSAIGSNDEPNHDSSHGIVINSGIIFAGTTKSENCTAIGGGGNAYGKVTINGGTVMAVATTTGTAIGGGIGYGSPGGVGEVYITGGNVYAYNFANFVNIPSSAIGGAGSKNSEGNTGTVRITGGYVYAYSALGTAIGGGSSQMKKGGDANITIAGGEVFARTGSKVSSSIGGGTACSGNTNGTANGGSAILNISGNPIIRTGSIGGGGHGIGHGYIGNATINVDGNCDVQAQFILAAGTGKGDVPSFTMTGGTICNSNTDNEEDTEYFNVKPDGGAVYLENGTVDISGGTIRNCRAQRGGAIYIEGSYDNTLNKYNASFKMSGGLIEDNESYRATGKSDKLFEGSGGAVYIIDGTVEITGGTIADNLAAGGNGGGVFIRRGSLKVSGEGTTIKDNAAEIRANHDGAYTGGNGGGIYVYSKVAEVDVNIESGKITENTADRSGGGLCVIHDIPDISSVKAKVTLGTEGGLNEKLQITGNRALLQGGGVYATGVNVNMTINSGTIKNNFVSQYVHNEDVANEMGEMTLNGGDVAHQVVTFNANYGETPATSIQRIVTETNSRLKTPEFNRIGYTLVGWNTKPTGTGDSYVDGQIMNINMPITLYAQWQIR